MRTKQRIRLKIECPQCHRLFRVVTESKELIQDEKVEDFREDRAEDVKDILEFLNPISVVPVRGAFGRDVAADDLTYEYRFKCKHCGYEWTELKEKEKISKT
jgi:rubredoxin